MSLQFVARPLQEAPDRRLGKPERLHGLKFRISREIRDLRVLSSIQSILPRSSFSEGQSRLTRTPAGRPKTSIRHLSSSVRKNETRRCTPDGTDSHGPTGYSNNIGASLSRDKPNSSSFPALIRIRTRRPTPAPHLSAQLLCLASRLPILPPSLLKTRPSPAKKSSDREAVAGRRIAVSTVETASPPMTTRAIE